MKTLLLAVVLVLAMVATKEIYLWYSQLEVSTSRKVPVTALLNSSNTVTAFGGSYRVGQCDLLVDTFGGINQDVVYSVYRAADLARSTGDWRLFEEMTSRFLSDRVIVEIDKYETIRVKGYIIDGELTQGKILGKGIFWVRSECLKCY